MNNKPAAIIIAVSLVAAVGGITFGIQATAGKNAALAEAQALRDQLDAGMAADPQTSDESGAVVALMDTEAVGTNDVSELQALLAEQDAELERLRAELERRSGSGPRLSFQERMAQLKEEDPERYEEMIQQRSERQEQMRYDQASRLAIFTELDTSGMSQEELANHNQLIERLTALWEVTEAYDPESPPDWQAFREAVGDFRELGRIMDQERTYIFKQLGTEVGLSGSDADDFAAYAQEIVEITSLRPPRGTRSGGRGN
jgi:hypothetical protein